MNINAYKKFIGKAVAVFLSIAAVSGIFSAMTVNAFQDAEWDEFISQKIAQDKTPGLAVAAVNGTEKFFENRGFSDIETQKPVTEDTVFGIGSCSKAFTALAIFLLQEEEKLTIDDSVSDYLPWWNVTWQGETQDTKIWQLLNHCSGIANSTMMQVPTDGEISNEKTALVAKNQKLAYEPETAFEYCNIGYDVLAYIVEVVSGMPFEDYVSQEILQPVGMIHSGYNIPTGQGYRLEFGKLTPFDEFSFTLSSGDGGLRSTAGDMSLWIDAQLGHTELPEKLANAISKSHENRYNVEMNEAMLYYNGWVEYDGYRFHSGTNMNFSSYLIIDEQRDMGIFAFTNAWMNTADYAANSLYSVMKGEPINTEQLNVIDIIAAVDKISTALTIIGAIAFIIILILLFTQKKRIAKKNLSYEKEKKRFITRIVLLPLLIVLTAFIPMVIPSFAGYGITGYKMIAAWFPYSFLIAFLTVDSAFILALISNIARFLYCRKTKT